MLLSAASLIAGRFSGSSARSSSIAVVLARSSLVVWTRKLPAQVALAILADLGQNLFDLRRRARRSEGHLSKQFPIKACKNSKNAKEQKQTKQKQNDMKFLR